MSNDLQVQQSPTIDWNGIFEQLADSDNGLLKAKGAYRAAMGVPRQEIAEQLGITESTIKGWQKDDPNYANAIELIRSNLASFIDNRLHLRVAQSDNYADWLLSMRSDSILTMDVSEGIKKELLKERGLMARKYLDIANDGRRNPTGNTFIGNQTQMTLNITPEAAKILLERNPDIQGKIIDNEQETTE